MGSSLHMPITSFQIQMKMHLHIGLFFNKPLSLICFSVLCLPSNAMKQLLLCIIFAYR